MSGSLLAAVLARRTPAGELAPRQWEQLLSEARKCALAASLAHQAMDEGWFERIPERPRRHFEAALREAAWRHKLIYWEIGCIERALRGLETPVVLLKGAAYLLGGLSAAKGRVFSDIDIMVRRERLEEAEAALIGAGWYSGDYDPYDQRFYRQWMHEIPPLQHVRRQSVIDLHHTISPLTSRTPVAGQRLFAAARPLEGFGTFSVLAPADMLLHSTLHLIQEGEFERGLRDLLDIDRLLREFGRDAQFWPALLDRTAEHGLGRPLYYAVQQARALLATPIPDPFLRSVERFAPDAVTRWVMGAALGAALAPVSAAKPGARAALSRWLLYVRGHYLRMPLRLSVPHLIRKGGRRLVALWRNRGAESIPVGGERFGAD